MVGIYALHDPMRSKIEESVKNCRKAGFTIRLVTGENIETAKAIAKEAGILQKNQVNEVNVDDDDDHKYTVMDG